MKHLEPQTLFSQVAVLGAGQMGSGIAQVIATKEVPVCLIDPSEAALKKAQEKIEASLNKLYSKQKIFLKPDRVLKKIQFETQFESLKESELIIEAVPEDKKIKLQIFKEISNKVKPEALITSNTSSIPLNELAQAVSYPKQVAGLHFMNPPPLMKLVEIIRTDQTSEAVFKKLLKFISFLDKVGVLSKDRPGFIVNRVLMPMINAAIGALENSVATAEDIDLAMQLGCHHPMGPLALADLIGLDTCLSIMQVLHRGGLGEKYKPCPLLEKYVSQGHLGKKSGKGFFTY